jgi:hypothetical protein
MHCVILVFGVSFGCLSYLSLNTEYLLNSLLLLENNFLYLCLYLGRFEKLGYLELNLPVCVPIKEYLGIKHFLHFLLKHFK